MSNPTRKLASALLTFLFVSAPVLATDYVGTVSELQASGNTTPDCFYFRLSGVTITPASPGNWFAVSRNANASGAKDVFATLLAARISETPVKVSTSGTLTCGAYVEATFVTL